MLRTTLTEPEFRMYQSLLAIQKDEFLKGLKREEDEAIYRLHEPGVARCENSAVTHRQYDIRRVIGVERLKAKALGEVMARAGKSVSPEQARELCKEAHASLADCERRFSQAPSSPPFFGKDRGTGLRMERFFREQRNALVREMSILVSSAELDKTRLSQSNTLDKPCEVFLEDIGCFSLATPLPKPSSIDHIQCLSGISEQETIKAFADIIGEPVVPPHWGGERSDLFTTYVTVRNRRVSTAFLFKGPARFQPMTLGSRVLGKNGDQIIRLFTDPADLFILQHCHEVTPPVRDMMRTYAEKGKTPRSYCIIDGFDTLRILSAYHKCGLG